MGRKKKPEWEKEIDKDIKRAKECADILVNIGNQELSQFNNAPQQGNITMLLFLINKYANKTKELQYAVNKEHQLGLSQGAYEQDEYWKELLKQERANCIYSAGSYDIDDATIQQHKYIGGFEAINRILKDM